MNDDIELVEVVHIMGIDVVFDNRRRQRCAWCGALIIDDDFTRMAWTLNEDGTDPGPPPAWPIGELVAMCGGENEGFRGLRVIPHDDLEDSREEGAPAGAKKVPDNCCMQFDSDVTR